MKLNKKVFKLLSVVLCLMFCLSITPLNAFASESKAGDIVDGTLLTLDSSSDGFYRAIARGTYLTSGTCNITNGGGGVIYISGTTLANRVCDNVEVYLSVDRNVNGSWVNIDNRGQVAYNTSECQYYTSIYVSPGYFYRVTASHIVRKGVVKETGSSYTNGIFIS
ncbi:DUF6147 family protein [Robinsoniella peoriensis]|uniref:DUF6147 family protein n=1 Tax=Robinsoniella peoriensis TaxID=180332 RepID=UPI0037539854